MVMTKFGRELVFFIAIAFLVVGAFQMPPLKDNKPWRRCLSVVVGLAGYGWALTGIFAGHITFWRNNTQTYFRALDPVEYWVAIGVIILLGSLLIYRGFRGVK